MTKKIICNCVRLAIFNHSLSLSLFLSRSFVFYFARVRRGRLILSLLDITYKRFSASEEGKEEESESDLVLETFFLWPRPPESFSLGLRDEKQDAHRT